jgi:hypothetical protein
MKKLQPVGIAIALILTAVPAMAQSDFMVFPHVADGYLGDGTAYRSTLTLTNWSASDVYCSADLYGMDVDFGTGRSSNFDITVPQNGFVSVRTTAELPIDTGYMTVACESGQVYGQLIYASYDLYDFKTGEATVFPTGVQYSEYRILADRREAAELGVAIANDTDLTRVYDLTLLDYDGFVVNTGQITVPPRSSTAAFLSQLLLPAEPFGSVHMLEVASTDFSPFSAIGLQYTGHVFTTVPAN